MDLVADGREIADLSKINVLLGRNGCGKSGILRKIDQYGAINGELISHKKYVTPERGGNLIYDGGVDSQVAQNIDNVYNQRRSNFFVQFRQQSVSLYNELIKSVHQSVEAAYENEVKGQMTTREIHDEINSLLDNILVVPDRRFLKALSRETGDEITFENVSSGEKELISLAIEILHFEKLLPEKEFGFLLLDEPDVHLHPDLQLRVANLLVSVANRSSVNFVVATHSTVFLSGLADYSDLRVFSMSTSDVGGDIVFKPASKPIKKIMPMFGTHPLTQVFNDNPILLVEGDSDFWVWHTAIRTSNDTLRLHPCSVDSKDVMNLYEKELASLLPSIYDAPLAYSLRDRDETHGEIDNEGCVIRMRLSCHEIENLLLCDEALEAFELTWPDFELRIVSWLSEPGQEKHSRYDLVKQFADDGFDRKNADIKKARLVFLGMLQVNKPWEVVVGQAIATAMKTPSEDQFGPNSALAYLGAKFQKHFPSASASD